MKYFYKLSAFMSLSALALLPLQAEVIFQDSFDTASTDINADLGTRQSGPSATQTYHEFGTSGNASISGNTLVVARTSGATTDYNTELNLDFGSVAALTVGGSFQVEFDVLTVGNLFTGFAFNGVQNQTRPVVDDTTDFGFLLLGSGHGSAGEISVREGTGEVSRATPAFGISGTIQLMVHTTGITTGNGFTVEMTVDGNTVDLDSSSAGTAFSGYWSSDSLYMDFNHYGTGTSTFDNFSVTAIPEPSSILYMLTGLSLFGVGFYRRRSR
ncbi:PEP-CTERM sorting domain-containing protein [Kiritimatiellaeota bacterium B1221]|nr:PEP-CTERM sorting domain-containing protein [Kiritimatiellaeota bacterium B1221]